ncbi:tripartite tricarboxylate transporter substrate binding protein [Schlegelella sp. ID0723]|uniref:Tripartite tricarboxylate transporter substrate binding protein n=1 Tax=Piscinibacter koreensis TaxID=2742824 RepID=A0A7Y6NQ93_9BURK|nr:tripartite tricarboxylate transporter substrate binding protein [Schlegelella koreensis]
MHDLDRASTRRDWLVRAAVCSLLPVALPTLAQPAGAAFHPTRSVRIVSPQQAGGSTDAILRPLAGKLAELWGQAVNIENKPGGGSIIATQTVVQAPPDGHTLGLAINSLTINPSLRSDLPYDTLSQLTPVTLIGSVTVALVVHASLGVDDLPGFVAYAKAKPGAVSWASLGIGTGGHVTGELLARRAGIDMVHVPFSGSSGAYRELLPGRVQAAFVVLESALPHLRNGTLRLLAVTDPRRNRQFPAVPTLAEHYPGLGYEGIFGIVAPAGLPPALLRALHADIVKILGDPEVREQLERQSMDVIAAPPQEFAQVIRREIEHWRVAVRESGAKLN